MRSPNKRKKSSGQGMTLMLLSNPGGRSQRFQIKQHHVIGVIAAWAFAMLLAFWLGFAV